MKSKAGFGKHNKVGGFAIQHSTLGTNLALLRPEDLFVTDEFKFILFFDDIEKAMSFRDEKHPGSLIVEFRGAKNTKETV